MSLLARLIGTWFYLGYFPKGPGTAGSLGALLVGIPLALYLEWPAAAFALLALALLGPAIWAADRMAREGGSKDPQIVVVDEVVGQWIALAGAPLLNWQYILGAFVLFRLFDIWKPWPVSWADRSIAGGLGVMADDMLAGLLAGLLLVLARYLVPL